MRYIEFLETIRTTLTGVTLALSGATGTTLEIVYTEMNLEDLLELNPNSFPNQKGFSGFVVPQPSQILESGLMAYSCRLYVVGQMREDASDRMHIISSCMEYIQSMILKLPATITLQYPIPINVSILFDATVEGVYADLIIGGVIGSPATGCSDVV